MIERRALLKGLGAALITAPAIVRAGSLMPVKVFEPEVLGLFNAYDNRIHVWLSDCGEMYCIFENGMSGKGAYLGTICSIARAC